MQPQDAYRHDGFYLRIGGGFDYLRLSGSGPDGNSSVSGASMGALIAIGGNVADGLVVAGAVNVGQTRNTFEGSPEQPPGKATASAGQLGVLVDWFPDPTGGWHVGGLAGLGFVGIAEAAVAESSGTGFGGALLGGYDWWIGPQWSLGLFAVATATTTGKLRERDGDETGYEFASWSLGLNYAFTLH